ncbi:hypothetical protein [Kitasatospora sp. CB02891]|nr:hypothetical protein [Kitasatospora sp. CB02891]
MPTAHAIPGSRGSRRPGPHQVAVNLPAGIPDPDGLAAPVRH